MTRFLVLWASLFVTLCASATAAEPLGVTYKAYGLKWTKGNRDFEDVSVEWSRTPQATDFSELDQKVLYAEGYVDARCDVTDRGTMKGCVITEASPDTPEMRQAYQKALNSFTLKAESNRGTRPDLILFSVKLTIPGGMKTNRNFCIAPFCTISPPPPPPPPPAAETAAIKDAIRQASQCLSFGSDGRGLAGRATRQLTAPVGSKEWNEAREVVLAYVRRRQEQWKCLADLETLRMEGRMTKQDRIALTFQLDAWVRHWLKQSVYEVGILRRLLGIPSPETEDRLPFNVH